MSGEQRDDELRQLARLLTEQRWAALATVGEDGEPNSSYVAFAIETDFKAVLLHLSQLAAHTRNLLARPTVSLAVTEPDDGRDDPQTLARVTLKGTAVVVPRESGEYTTARERYLERLPAAGPLFGFGDFQLFHVEIAQARYVGGFARARTFGPEALSRAAGLIK